MHRVAYWLTPLIALGVALFIVVLLYKINQGEPGNVLINKSGSSQKHSGGSAIESGWLERFSESERLGYFFPVNEIYIDVDLNQKIVSQTIYQLKAVIKDPYQLFCLKEELNQYKLNYFLQNDKTNTLLLINSKDIKRLEQLVQTLHNYEILATVLPFKEEEAWKNTK